MLKHKVPIYCLVVLLAAIELATPAMAQFGGGTTIVFDPAMYARQLRQLEQETATVTNQAQQLQLMIQNTTGGGAGMWQSNQNLLSDLGGLISEQQGLSYTFQGLAQQFQQLYPGYGVTTTPGVQSPQASVSTTLNTLNGALQSAQSQAQNFQNEQTALQALELKNQTAVGNLQAVQVSNEIALAQVQQIQLLRQLVMAQMNSQNTAAASQLNSQTQSDLEVRAFFGAPTSSSIPDVIHQPGGGSDLPTQ
ncbi:MAG: P-type conjugative transfer protein TrbJ [Candidatus Binataceae bacterium]